MDLNDIDLSVASSFLKNQCIIYRNYELLDETNIAEEYSYDGINVENFDTEKNNLKSYIKLKYINKMKSNTAALEEIDKLKKLRNRLFDDLFPVQKDKTNLNTRDKNEFLCQFMKTVWYRNLKTPSQDIKADIEKSISTLINYIVNDNKSYAFDALKLETKFKDEVTEEPIVDVNFTDEQKIEFPDIILDDDKGIPVVILTELNLLDKIIFHTSKTDEVSPASFSKFNSAMECPLFLINDPDISESIGYFYTLDVYKQLLENTTKTEPRTRRPYHGGLVLVDTDEFDKYNDYILSATYFNFKKVNYNKGLFYYVLWKNCEKKEWMDKNVAEQFKKYTMRRISTTVCKIGLSSLPLDPPENTSLLTALWYCVELSSCIFKDDPQHFMYERLRMHYGVAYCMIEILKYFKYNLDLESIEKRRDLIRHILVGVEECSPVYCSAKIKKNEIVTMTIFNKRVTSTIGGTSCDYIIHVSLVRQEFSSE
ncbi:Early 94 kDa protein [Eumeta japonica]|uniref:Early 94 kDa protein n=1 Tax=Eumeta variegata TaxID=151549 RepID=A0A4C1UML7_EUMVA|nr:Early 94 kDa protein [Eumeta japonica]